MGLSVFLMFLEEFQLFSKDGIFDHLWRNNTLVKPFGDFGHASAHRPCVFNNLEDIAIDSPLNLSQNI